MQLIKNQGNIGYQHSSSHKDFLHQYFRYMLGRLKCLLTH